MPNLSLRLEGDHSSIYTALTFYLRLVNIARDPFDGKWYLNNEAIPVEKSFEVLGKGAFEAAMAARLGPRKDPLAQSETILARIVQEKITNVRLDHRTSSVLPTRVIDDLHRQHPRLSVVLVWHGVTDSYGRYGWVSTEDGLELVDETFTREVDVLDSLGLPIVDETASGTFRENAPSGPFLEWLSTYQLTY